MKIELESRKVVAENEFEKLAIEKYGDDLHLYAQQRDGYVAALIQFQKPISLISDDDKKEAREKVRNAIQSQLNVADGVGRMSNYNIAQMILTELEMYHNAEILYSIKEFISPDQANAIQLQLYAKENRELKSEIEKLNSVIQTRIEKN